LRHVRARRRAIGQHRPFRRDDLAGRQSFAPLAFDVRHPCAVRILRQPAMCDDNGSEPMRFRIAAIAAIGLPCLAPGAFAQGASDHSLFQSDMAIMTGMTLHDPMGGMVMPGWHLMDIGIARGVYNYQGGNSGDEAFESSNWNMFHASHDLFGGRVTLMLMNSL